MIHFGKHEKTLSLNPPQHGRLVPIVLASAVFLVSVLFAILIWRSDHARDQLRFRAVTLHVITEIRSRIEMYIAGLRGLSGLFATHPNVRTTEFAEYVDTLQLHQLYPGIQAMGFSYRVPPGTEERLVTRMRNEKVDSFRLWPNHSEPERHTILYLRPLDKRNQTALGYDMFTEPVRRAAMEQARDTGEPAISRKVSLIQEIYPGKQAGFLVYLPVYRPGAPIRTVEERRQALVGFVYAPFRADVLLRGVVNNVLLSKLELAVYDGAETVPDALLHRSDTEESREADSGSLLSPLTEQRTFLVVGHPWTIVTRSLPEFERASHRWHAWFVLIFGGVLALILYRIARIRQRAADTERLHRHILESVVEGVVVSTADGVITYTNPSEDQMFGYARGELIGKHVSVLNSYPPLENWRKVNAVIEQLRRTGAWFGEWDNIRKDGSRFTSSSHITRLKFFGTEYYVCVQEDVTEARRYELELRESEERFRNLADSAPVLIWMSDNSKGAVYFNKTWLDFIGAPLDQQLGDGWMAFVHPDDKHLLEPCAVAFAKREPFQTQFRMRRFDGEYRVILDTGVPRFSGPGEFEGFTGSCLDITDIKRAEDQLGNALAIEREARSAAEHASRMKDEFLATLSHELRTPLSAILGWVNVVRRHIVATTGARTAETNQNGQAQLIKGLETIERNARLQARIIEDLLDMNRIISGKVKLDVQNTPIAEVLESALESIRPSAEGKRIRLHCDKRIGLYVRADPARLQQILWNLLSNAIKFTPPEGTVSCHVRKLKHEIEFSVTDTGEGIPQEFLPHVFDRFRQADSSTSRRHSGLGLGLAIVRHLTELHGGRCWAESEGAGRGSTFTVRLPRPKERIFSDSNAQLTGAGGQLELQNGANLSGVKILVIDDQEDQSSLIRQLLEDREAEVRTAASAEEGFFLVREYHPDVIVSDISMPGEDGFQLLRRIRNLSPEEGRDTPAVALTALARVVDSNNAEAAGFQRFIPKPFEPEDLVQAVASLSSPARSG